MAKPTGGLGSLRKIAFFVVLAGCPESPCWVDSLEALDELLERAVRPTYHGWETAEEGVAYARAAGFYNISEWRR